MQNKHWQDCPCLSVRDDCNSSWFNWGDSSNLSMRNDRENDVHWHSLKVYLVEILLRKTLFLIALTLTLTCAVWAKPAPSASDIALKPTPTQAQTAVLAARFLTRFHYKPEALDAKMSQQIFDRYLDALDSDRLFLLQSTVD